MGELTLGAYVDQLMWFSVDGEPTYTIDDHEAGALFELATESKNPDIRLLAEALFSGGQFVTRYGGPQRESLNQGTALEGGNLCLNFSLIDQSLPCDERGTLDRDYDAAELSTVEPAPFPAISDEIRARYSARIFELSLASLDPSIAGSFKRIHDHIGNATMVESEVKRIFEEIFHPATALLYETILLSLVSTTDRIDRQTKKYYGKLVMNGVSNFNRRFQTFLKEEMGQSVKNKVVSLPGSVPSSDGAMNTNTFVTTVFAQETLDKLFPKVMGEIQSALAVIIMFKEIVNGIAEKDRGVLSDNWDVKWKEGYCKDIWPNTDPKLFDEFTTTPYAALSPDQKERMQRFFVSFFEHAYHSWASRRHVESFRDDHYIVESIFGRVSPTIYEIYGNANMFGWRSLVGLLGTMPTGIVPSFLFGLSGGFWDKTSNTIDRMNIKHLIPYPRVQESKEAIIKQLSFYHELDGGTVIPKEMVQSLASEGLLPLKAADASSDWYLACDPDGERSGCYVSRDNSCSDTEFHSETNMAGVLAALGGFGKKGLVTIRDALRKSCKIFFATQAMNNYQYFSRLTRLDEEQMVGRFYVGIDEDGDLVPQTSLQIGSEFWHIGLDAVIVGGSWWLCQHRKEIKTEPPDGPSEEIEGVDEVPLQPTIDDHVTPRVGEWRRWIEIPALAAGVVVAIKQGISLLSSISTNSASATGAAAIGGGASTVGFPFPVIIINPERFLKGHRWDDGVL